MLGRKKNLIIMLVLAMVLLMAFCACDSNSTPIEEGSKHVLLVVGTDEYNVTTEANYLHDLLVELDEKNIITYEYSDDAFGATILSVNSLKTDIDWDPFISIYHSIDEVTLRADFGEYAMSKYTYKSKEYYPSSVGVSMMPVYDNATYILVETNL